MKFYSFSLLITWITIVFWVPVNAQNSRIPSKGYAKFSKDTPLKLYEFERHPIGDNDVLIEILYSGICHSDMHSVWGDWFPNVHYPLIPGHEIVGKVTQIGTNVSKFKVGDYAGVGCMVNSCGKCEHCQHGEEQFCDNHQTVYTYGSPDRFHNNEFTQGGYSNNIVVSEKFALKIPQNADLKRIAPLLCAGITTYSPLKFTHVQKGDKVAIAGFGGLGHIALQYAVSFGAEVTVFDITDDKRQDALRMGAVKYVNVNNSNELKGLGNQYRVILSTIPANYDVEMYIRMLKVDGELVIIGIPAADKAPSIKLTTLNWNSRRKIYGTLIGGIPETQEMLDYSVSNNIYPQVEIISVDKIDEAYQNVLAGKVRYRYVIDMSTLKIK